VVGAIHHFHPVPQWKVFVQSQEFYLLLMIADSPLLSKSPSGLNFDDDSGPSPLAD
jgi:hypothetical protein